MCKNEYFHSKPIFKKKLTYVYLKTLFLHKLDDFNYIWVIEWMLNVLSGFRTGGKTEKMSKIRGKL